MQWLDEGYKPLAQDPQFKDHVDLEIVWFGNGYWDTKENVPVCQHGPNECVGNMVMECSKEILPKDLQLEYAFCMSGTIWPMMEKSFQQQAEAEAAHKASGAETNEEASDAEKTEAKAATKEETAADVKNATAGENKASFLQNPYPAPAKGGISERCAASIPGVKKLWSKIRSCASGQRGMELIQRAADLTKSVEHVHTPWVTTYDTGMLGLDWPILGAGFKHQPQAESNPMKFACRTIPAGSERPDSCKGILPDKTGQHMCGGGSHCFFNLPADDGF